MKHIKAHQTKRLNKWRGLARAFVVSAAGLVGVCVGFNGASPMPLDQRLNPAGAANGSGEALMRDDLKRHHHTLNITDPQQV